MLRCGHLACPEQAISIRLDMLSRPLELDCVPTALGDDGDDAAVGAVQLRPRLQPVDANALPCSERLLARPVYSGRRRRIDRG